MAKMRWGDGPLSHGEVRIGIVSCPHENYLLALRENGAVPVAVDGEIDPGEYDGLLLPGGGDIDPGRYGQERLPACGEPDPALDERQLRALEAFAAAGKPVLGICRGLQLVNVGFGGTLLQHLPRAADHMKRNGADNAHGTVADAGGWIFGLYGGNPVVNSAHHQGVDRLGEGLRAAQWAPDGVVEALEHERLPIFAVQWHPERMRGRLRREGLADGDGVFLDFVKRCGRER